MHGAGAFLAGVYTVAFNFTPSRIGILTPHWKLDIRRGRDQGRGTQGSEQNAYQRYSHEVNLKGERSAAVSPSSYNIRGHVLAPCQGRRRPRHRGCSLDPIAALARAPEKPFHPRVKAYNRSADRARRFVIRPNCG